jgi:hypothetical protein
MKLIAHRGNVTGPNPLRENSLEYIDESIKLGYDVEIDIRYVEWEHQLYLGHDECQYPVSMLWLNQRKDKLWIHCKNLSSLKVFCDSPVNFNYFWHQTDDFTLTSTHYIWTYPGKPYTHKSVIVMPECSADKSTSVTIKDYDCYGICSDYVGEIN